MSKPYKPDAFNSVSPYIVADDAARVIAFLKDTFRATDLRHIQREDGRIRHAEVRIDDSVVMIADAPDGYEPVPACIHVYVPDVDAAYQRALNAGGTSIEAPSRSGDSDRRGGVKDPAGNAWWIGTQEGDAGI